MTAILSSLINELERNVNELLSVVNHANYEQIVELVDKKEEIVSNLLEYKEELSLDTKEKIKALMIQDSLVISRMQSLKDEATEWLLKRESIKEQRSAYNMNYTPDSFFFDKKN
ncbi:hypothetical protein [Paenibacillus sp. PDC88]|uniref:hypothetical protein n=1 Tax=Paenibacillus sp. PDC88 TaxID=1884375 RepID=UPI00089C27C6|nr:hypothetical protein [Paenibacillus sp. PDC88]SDW83681.1 hypothetical protein SAMN05518848_10369 [Paenibacillus sp. PDC88]